jgi:hypothetical protein
MSRIVDVDCLRRDAALTNRELRQKQGQVDSGDGLHHKQAQVDLLGVVGVSQFKEQKRARVPRDLPPRARAAPPRAGPPSPK